MSQWIYGRNTVKQLLENHKVNKLLIVRNTNKDILSVAKRLKIKIRMIDSRQELSQFLKSESHQGVAAKVESYDYTPLDDILKSIPHNEQPLLLMLDGLKDPHNLGAILRTCDAIGVHGVILGKNRSVGLNSTVAKVSTGAIDYIPVASVTNLTRTLEDLKKKGFWIVGCENDDSQDYRAIDYNMPTVIVIGSEGEGISRLVKKSCDIRITIPMTGHVNSLNASVATAVILYQVYQSRHPL